MLRAQDRTICTVSEGRSSSGTLFEGRFRSAVIETDSYLLACLRYIELNPVRASMVRTPEDYPWSSYRCNALGVADPVITPHPLYLDLADADEARRSRYRGLVADVQPQDMLTALRDATNGGFVLGNQRFQKQIATMVGRRTWPGTSGRPRKESADTNQRGLPI